MKIVFKKRFTKQYEKLRDGDQLKVDESLYKFALNPFDPVLKNHALHGKMAEYRSISAANNIRIVFEVVDDYFAVIMISVGSHNQVY